MDKTMEAKVLGLKGEQDDEVIFRSFQDSFALAPQNAQWVSRHMLVLHDDLKRPHLLYELLRGKIEGLKNYSVICGFAELSISTNQKYKEIHKALMRCLDVGQRFIKIRVIGNLYLTIAAFMHGESKDFVQGKQGLLRNLRLAMEREWKFPEWEFKGIIRSFEWSKHPKSRQFKKLITAVKNFEAKKGMGQVERELELLTENN